MDAAGRVHWVPGAVLGRSADYNHLAVWTAEFAWDSVALCYHRQPLPIHWVHYEAVVASCGDENDPLGSRGLIEFAEYFIKSRITLYQLVDGVVVDFQRVSFDITVPKIGIVDPSAIVEACYMWSTVNRTQTQHMLPFSSLDVFGGREDPGGSTYQLITRPLLCLVCCYYEHS